MTAHSLRLSLLAALAIGLATAPSTRAAGPDSSRMQYLTFSRSVALPGVALNAGTYIFELAAPDSAPDIVRVSSRDRKIVYFTAFTRRVDRPSGMPLTELVSVREASAGQPVPLAVWWSEASAGRQFIYAR